MAGIDVETSRILDGVRNSKIRLDISSKLKQRSDSLLLGSIQALTEQRHHRKLDVRRVERDFARLTVDEISRRIIYQSYNEIESSKRFDLNSKLDDDESWFRGCYGIEDPFHEFYNGDGESVSLITRFKRNLPAYDGFWHIENLFTWIDAIEDFFQEINPPEHLKCKIVWYKMKGVAYYWWKQLQNERIGQGKEEIKSWSIMRELLIFRFAPSNCSTKVHSESNGIKSNGTTDFSISGASEVVYVGDGHSKEMSEVKPAKCLMEFPMLSSNETTMDEDYIEETTDTKVVTHLRSKHACSNTSVQLSADDLQPKQRTLLVSSRLLNFEFDRTLMEESQMESFVNCNTPTIQNSMALLIKSTASIGHEKVNVGCWMTPEAIPPSLIDHRPLMEDFVGPCVVQRSKFVKVRVVRYVRDETRFWVLLSWLGAYGRMVVFLFDPGGVPYIAIMRNFGNYLSFRFGLLLHCPFLKIDMETEILSFRSSSIVKTNFVCCGVIGTTHIEMPLLEASVNWCDQNHTSCMFLCGNADHEFKFLEIINGWLGGVTILEPLSPPPLKFSSDDGTICVAYFVSRQCRAFVIEPTKVVAHLLCCYLSSISLTAEALSFIFDPGGKWKNGPIKGIRLGQTKLNFLKDFWVSREQQLGETSMFKQLIFKSSFLVEEYTFGKGNLCYGGKMSDEHQNLLLPIPNLVQVTFFGKYARQNVKEPESKVVIGINQFVGINYDSTILEATEFVHTDFTLASLNKLILCLFYGALVFSNVSIVNAPTGADTCSTLRDMTREVIDTTGRNFHVQATNLGNIAVAFHHLEISRIEVLLRTCLNKTQWFAASSVECSYVLEYYLDQIVSTFMKKMGLMLSDEKPQQFAAYHGSGLDGKTICGNEEVFKIATISYFLMTCVHLLIVSHAATVPPRSTYMQQCSTSLVTTLTKEEMRNLVLQVLIHKFTFHIPRGRVIPLKGWNDECDPDIEGKFIMAKIRVTISSCLSILCRDGNLKKTLKLFHKLVNGLDPPKTSWQALVMLQVCQMSNTFNYVELYLINHWMTHELNKNYSRTSFCLGRDGADVV